MKSRSPFLTIMIIVLLLSCSVVFGAYNMTFKESVLLPSDQNTVYTGSHAGNYGQGTLTVIYGSAGNAKLYLQTSTGDGWSTLTEISAIPGGSDSTNIWGRHDKDYLYRVVVQSDPMIFNGNPGRIAYGYLYTGFEG